MAHVDIAVAKRDERFKGAAESSRRCRALHACSQVGEIEAGVGEEVSPDRNERLVKDQLSGQKHVACLSVERRRHPKVRGCCKTQQTLSAWTRPAAPRGGQRRSRHTMNSRSALFSVLSPATLLADETARLLFDLLEAEMKRRQAGVGGALARAGPRAWVERARRQSFGLGEQ